MRAIGQLQGLQARQHRRRTQERHQSSAPAQLCPAPWPQKPHPRERGGYDDGATNAKRHGLHNHAARSRRGLADLWPQCQVQRLGDGLQKDKSAPAIGCFPDYACLYGGACGN